MSARRGAEALVVAGAGRGDSVGAAAGPDWLALAFDDWSAVVAGPEIRAVVEAVEDELRPRWTWWSAETARALRSWGARTVALCWDLAAVHRLLVGGWADDPERVWASANYLAESDLPAVGQLDLLADLRADASRAEGGDIEDPVRPDGYLRPEWARDGWARTPERGRTWAALALRTAGAQRRALGGLTVDGSLLSTAYVESAAELIAVELGQTGLPVDRVSAEEVVREFAGRRPADAGDSALVIRERDQRVHRQLPDGSEPDLRSPAQVKAMLARLGLDLPDTRSWRLERNLGAHPVIEALLTWRTAERYATTYGYGWLDKHLHADGRLRGQWRGSDGGAGRMTAQAGLHNMPAALRTAVRAEPGYVLVRADLGQIEPRVLAAVSGDAGLIAAAQADDLYLPVAARLRCERRIAKVAMLSAMYGGTSGNAAAALAEMRTAYPAAIRFLRAADQAGRENRAIRTYGGRLLPLRPLDPALDAEERRAVAASRGRYIRNAVVQGAAAEFFKAWTATIRAHVAALRSTGWSDQDPAGEIVMCLHDELLLHVREEHAEDIRRLLHTDLVDAASRWFPATRVRFVADIAILNCWADAKG